MRTTVLLAGAAVVVLVGGGTTSPSAPPSTLAADLAGSSAGPSDGAEGGFDGRLYPDPETGCIRPWREGDGAPPPAPEDVSGPRAVPHGPSVQVQEPAPPPSPFGETHRGPWPICDDPPSAVRDGGTG